MAQYSTDKGSLLNNNDTLYEVVMVAGSDGSVGTSGAPMTILPDGLSHVNKFGYTGDDVNGTSTIWDGNDTASIYPYPADGVVSITSTSGSDTGEEVEVQGLDADFNQAVEMINVGSTGTTTFSRVFRARKVNATNVGTVDVNMNGTLAAQILPGNGQTLMAVYTIPAGKTGYLLQFQGSSDKQTAVQFKLFAREYLDHGAFNLKGQWGVQGGNVVTYDYKVPLVFPEKTDLRVDITTGNNCGGGAIFDLILR
jgi:hypothetical protein